MINWNNLSNAEQRYVKSLEPHFNVIVDEFKSALTTVKDRTSSSALGNKLTKVFNLDPDLIKIGLSAMVREKIIEGIESKRKMGCRKIAEIKLANDFVCGDTQAPKRMGRISRGEVKEVFEARKSSSPSIEVKPLSEASSKYRELKVLKDCIKSKCMDCQGEDRAAVKGCTIKSCPLFLVRPFQQKIADLNQQE